MKAEDFLVEEQPQQIAEAFLAPSHAPEMAQAHQAQIDPLAGAAIATRPILEGGGAMVGGVFGAPLGPPGMLAGGGLGYSIGKKLADIIEEQTGARIPPPLLEQLVQSGQDVGTGAAYEMAGASAGPAIAQAGKAVGKVAKPVLGRLSGVGTAAVEEAGKLSEGFKKALRGEISGEEVVTNAKDALNILKGNRASEYQQSLESISKNSKDINVDGFLKKVTNTMKRYNVDVNPDGTTDTSRVPMGKSGRNDINDVIETIMDWGTKPGDRTATGLDTLKRQLDDFYSESGQARAFVAELRNSVKNSITEAVPEYGKMTAKYAEATKLIKDIESGLMTRNQGMSGRIVSDQTLRRLMTAMRDNFTLRKELVDALGAESGKDIAGQVAGHSMSQLLPRGLAGTGPALAGQAAFAMFNPKFWPVLAASSPRLQGEFIRYFSIAAKHAGKIPDAAKKEVVRQGLIMNQQKNQY